MGVEVEIVDRGYEDLVKELKKLDGSYSAVGWFGHGGTPRDDVAARMAVINFGTKIGVTEKMRRYLAGALGIFLKKTTKFITIPARPVIENTATKTKNGLQKRKEAEVSRMIERGQTAKQTVARLGEWYVGETKKEMRGGKFAPLHPATAKKKGSTKPLIDTGQVLNSTTHREIMK
jgi:hypothetical protein